ncbi:MAG: hypothetical protein ACRD0Y_14040 [Terriglobales bacterium]
MHDTGVYLTDLNQRVAVRTVGGVNVFGKSAYPHNPAVRRFVVFELRRATFASDAAFWSAAARAIPARAHVDLYAYCDGTACSTDARRARLPFPVIEFASVNNLEAVANADVKGEFLVLRPHLTVLARAQWRGSSASPAGAVRTILQ